MQENEKDMLDEYSNSSALYRRLVISATIRCAGVLVAVLVFVGLVIVAFW